MIETLLVIGGVIGVSAIGFFVLSQNTHLWPNRIYALMSLSFAVLMTANLFTSGLSTDTAVVLSCIRLVAASTSFIMFLLYILLSLLLNNNHLASQRQRIFAVGLLVATGVVVLLDMSPFVFHTVTIDTNDGLTVAVGWAAVLFAVHALTLLYLSIEKVIVGLRQHNRSRRGQSLSILIGLAPAFILAPITSFILPIVYHQVLFVAITPLYIVFFVAMVAYAMVRHGLFDIRFAAVRTAAYVLTLLTLAGIYYALVYLVSLVIFRSQSQQAILSVNPANIGMALLIAFIFQPIKRFFDRVTERLFYKGNYSISGFISQLNQTLNSTNDLRLLLERTSSVISSTLKAEQAFFLVMLEDGRYLTAGTRRHSKITSDDITNADFNIILASDLELTDPNRRMMISHRIELMMPLKKNNVLIGYLCLGEHLAGDYRHRDLRALMTISDELTIAIQNALAVEEVKRLNETLEQRISNATKELRTSNLQLQRLDEVKDEFISMASHQLRTPLTSVKGYISMVLEGDVGKVSPQQKHLLNEALLSSERMVRLIGDFLNVSRLQTGKFMIEKHATDLVEVVKQEISSLETSAISRGLKFEFKPPKTFPMMMLDENKVRQVIMNFSDNAIYYSKEKSTIKIGLKLDNNEAVFTVKDSGIGVPLAEQPHLFGKFFRAENARRQRPDGTGVGLFLAKKVIDAHNGSVIFESKEGKGSTFGFRIPVVAPESSMNE